MNKELTPLEALEKIEKSIIEIYLIKNIPHPECPDTEKYINKSWHFDIIETALKKQEQDQKKLKAFEIIKEKRVDMHQFLDSVSLHDYNENGNIGRLRKLTQEEYEIVKECFNNEY